LRLWLVSQAAKLRDVQPAKVWQRVRTLLPAGGQPEAIVKSFCLQFLQLVCEVSTSKVCTTRCELEKAAMARVILVAAITSWQCAGLQALAPISSFVDSLLQR